MGCGSTRARPHHGRRDRSAASAPTKPVVRVSPRLQCVCRTDLLPVRESQHSQTACQPEARGQPGELDPRYRAIPIVGVGTGLRPEELFGLHRTDVDRQAGLLHVRRRFTGGMVKEGGKTDGSVRSVPLRRRVLDALDAMPSRIDTPILFPAPRGGYIDGERFRHREWAPALRAAGVEHRRVNDMRDTFATWAIEEAASTSGSSRRSWGRASRSSKTRTRAG